MNLQGNKEQKVAITHKDGPCMVVAPPGSGKTTVILERILYLAEECQIPSNEILVITFTKAAALEMQERFFKKCKEKRYSVVFGTFHAIYFQILKDTFSFTSSNIITPHEKREILKMILQKTFFQENLFREEEETEEFYKRILAEISRIKNSGKSVESYEGTFLEQELFGQIYKEYNAEMKYRKKVDFDDMLLQCLQLLQSRADILRKWRSTFSYIMIDEFQDINPLQFRILQLLAKPRNNLFFVGDDDQAIYGFRGANPQIMLDLPKAYPNTKQTFLSVNYRSTHTIIKASQNLISNNRHRYQKNIRGMKEQGEEVRLYECPSFAEEVEQMIALLKKNSKDTAVLLRTNDSASYFAERFLEEKIPFTLKENVESIYSHFIAKDIFAYLKFSKLAPQRSYLYQILNKPTRYIKREAIAEPLVDFQQVRNYYKGNSSMQARIRELSYQMQLLAQMNLYAGINYIRKGIGYENYLRKKAREKNIEWKEYENILKELQKRAKDFSTLKEWLQHMEAYEEELLNQERKRKCDTSQNTEAVQLLTMHSSKGLEFTTVIIPQLTEGNVPHHKARTNEDMEEERRLFYVAMTRAKEKLYLFYSKENRDAPKEASRFVQELRLPVFSYSSSSSSNNSSYSELSKNSSKAAETASNSSSLSIYSKTGSSMTSSSFS